VRGREWKERCTYREHDIDGDVWRSGEVALRWARGQQIGHLLGVHGREGEERVGEGVRRRDDPDGGGGAEGGDGAGGDGGDGDAAEGRRRRGGERRRGDGGAAWLEEEEERRRRNHDYYD
jgi:hypothetical protein